MDRTDLRRRALPGLSALGVVLLAALVLAPARLAGLGDRGLADRRALTDEVHRAFVVYWRSGASAYPPELTRVVDYWARYSVIEAVIASALLVVLVVLARLLRGAPPDRARRASSAARAVVRGGLLAGALVAGWVLIRSLQGAFAPFGAVLPLLRDGTQDGALTATVAQVTRHLAHTASAPAPPALAAMTGDYARYHVVRAVAVAIAALWLLVAAGRLWAARGERRRAAAVSCVVVCLALAVIGAANLTTAADPEPGLLGFFEGGW